MYIKSKVLLIGINYENDATFSCQSTYEELEKSSAWDVLSNELEVDLDDIDEVLAVNERLDVFVHERKSF